MDQNTRDFVEAFQAFLHEVVAEHRTRAAADEQVPLAPVLREHLGASSATTTPSAS